MTITAEPPSQTLPQYRHQPLHTPDSPLTSRLSVVGTMHDRFEEILTDDALDFVWAARPVRRSAGRTVGGPAQPRRPEATVSLSDRNGRDPRIRHGESRRSLPGSRTVAARSPDRQRER